MTTRSLFIRFPAFPFGFQDLMPDPHLARLAGALLAGGHPVEIEDYGTVGTLERLFPGEHRDSMNSLLDENDRSRSANPLSSLVSIWRTHTARQSFQVKLESVCREIARNVAQRRDIGIVVLKIDTPRHFEASIGIAKAVRAANPRILLVGTGGNVGAFQRRALGKSGPLDVLLLADSGAGLVALADHPGEPLRWASAPNLLYTLNGVVLRSARSDTPHREAPGAEYSSEVYPSANGDEKARVFAIEGGGSSLYASSSTGPARSGAEIACELERLHALYGAKAFHVDCPALSPSQLRCFLREMRLRRLRISYSLKSGIENVDQMLLAGLKSSGCHSIGFDVPSGSQRLLKDYYMRGFGVTEAEQTLRAAKSAGLYTVAHLVYPSPLDDYHTEAETLRLIDRTKPHAAPVHSGGVAAESEDDAGRVEGRGRGRRPAAACTRGLDWFHELEDAVPSRPRDSRRALADEIEGRGISTGVTERTALLAALSGYAGREAEFYRILRRQLFTGDTVGVAAWAAALNRAACDPVRTTATEPWDEIQAAVGN